MVTGTLSVPSGIVWTLVVLALLDPPGPPRDRGSEQVKVVLGCVLDCISGFIQSIESLFPQITSRC